MGFPNGCDDNPTPYSNRVVTLFVYLCDVREGGATRFPRCKTPEGKPLDIKPRQGMGCIHFPARLGTHSGKGLTDERPVHIGMPAVDEKFVTTQWGRTGPFIRPLMDEEEYNQFGRLS